MNSKSEHITPNIPAESAISSIDDDTYVIKIETKEQAEQIANLLNSKVSENPNLQQAMNEYNKMVNNDSKAAQKLRDFDLF